MTLLMTEGFEYIPISLNSDSLQRGRVLGAAGFYNYNNLNPPTVVSPGRFDFGQAIKLDASGFALGKAFPSGQTHFYWGCACKVLSGFNSGSGEVGFSVAFMDTVINRACFQLEFDNFGTIKVRDWVTTIMGYSGPGVFRDNNWFFLEVMGKIGETDGAVEVRINTKTVVSLINRNTIPLDGVGECHAFTWDNEAGSYDVLFDDMYLCNASGIDNNYYLGNVRVQGLDLTGPGNQTEWFPTPMTDANWVAASNKELDDDSYVYSSWADTGKYDLYTVDPLVNSPNIYGVTVKGAYRQTDATQQYAQNAVRTNGADFALGTLATDQEYLYLDDVYELNPATLLGWTYAEVNSIEIGPKHGVAP